MTDFPEVVAADGFGRCDGRGHAVVQSVPVTTTLGSCLQSRHFPQNSCDSITSLPIASANFPGKIHFQEGKTPALVGNNKQGAVMETALHL